jgi:glycosyltransferase involved in cell wall biosynthesis
MRTYTIENEHLGFDNVLTIVLEYSKANIDSDLLSNIQNGKKHFLTVGRVVPNKGHSHLIQTIRNYVNFFGPEVQLHIIGSLSMQDKRYYYELERLINRFHLGEQIIFHQNVNFDQMHTYYSVCDAFLMMSEHEGFCVPIAEAQFHELPVIALDRGGIAETLGANQLLLKEADYDLFAVALHRITKDQPLKDQLTTTGTQNYNHRFRSEVILQQLLSLF